MKNKAIHNERYVPSFFVCEKRPMDVADIDALKSSSINALNLSLQFSIRRLRKFTFLRKAELKSKKPFKVVSKFKEEKQIIQYYQKTAKVMLQK